MRLSFFIKQKRTIKAFSLAEMVITLGVFSIIVLSLSGFFVASIRFSANRWFRINALTKLEDVTNAILANKNDLWQSITTSTNQGAKYLQFSNNLYQIVDGTTTSDSISLNFQIGEVNRDGLGNIVQSGGSVDVFSRSITINASWTDQFGFANSVNTIVYVTNWNSYSMTDTAYSDFNSGTKNYTAATNNAGGEAQMETVVYADWCRPNNTTTNYDLPGQGVAQAITAVPGNAFIGTGANASGLSFANVLIDNNDPPVVTVPGTFDGYKTNAVFGESGYAYLATDTNAEEVVIIQLSATPYTKVGYFNAPGNGSGSSIYVLNNKGYMTAGNKLYIFDLTSKIGSRTQLGSVNLGGNGTKILINGNYAYITTTSTNTQLQIVDITDAANPTVVGQAALAGLAATDVFINSAATRAYVVTESSATLKEFFIVDISTKTGARTTISSYDTNGMSPKGVMITPDGTNRAIVIGSGGEEYQVVNIENEATPVRCGGTNIDTGVFGVAPVVGINENAYSYIVTGDSNSELKIIRGGPGGHGGVNGQGYTQTADFTSRVLDSGSTTPYYYTLTWNSAVPASTSLKFQLRSGDTSDLSSSNWMGPDGTSSTYFTLSSGESLSSIPTKRYVQYKAFFGSDTISTPILNDLKITYQK